MRLAENFVAFFPFYVSIVCGYGTLTWFFYKGIATADNPIAITICTGAAAAFGFIFAVVVRWLLQL